MSRREAALFPLYASGALFGLYLFFKVCVVHVYSKQKMIIISNVLVFFQRAHQSFIVHLFSRTWRVFFGISCQRFY